ncbi:HEAT repeat domain-containing protein [Planctomycetota bacterium]
MSRFPILLLILCLLSPGVFRLQGDDTLRKIKAWEQQILNKETRDSRRAQAVKDLNLLCTDLHNLEKRKEYPDEVRRAAEALLKSVLAFCEDRVMEAFVAEDDRYEALNLLSELKLKESSEVLEGLLLFEWESGATGRTDGQRSRMKYRKLKQSRESMAKYRAKAAEALGILGLERAIPIMLRVLRVESNPVVREYTLKALLEFEDPTLVHTYEGIAVEDQAETNRILGIVGMAAYPRKISTEAVKKILNDANVMVRLSGLKFLGNSGRPDLLPFIISASYDRESLIRRRVADVLVAFDTPGAAQVLYLMAKSGEGGTAISAVASLGQNIHVKGTDYLKLALRTSRMAGNIVIKSSYNRWADLTPADYAGLEKSIDRTLVPTIRFVSRKMAFRRKLGRVSKESEKIRLFLTEWSKKCKL